MNATSPDALAPWRGQRLAYISAFMPPTVADGIVLEAALGWSSDVQALLLIAPDDPIGPQQRIGWLRELAPRIHILPVEPSPPPGDEPLRSPRLQGLVKGLRAASPEALIGPGLRDRELAAALGLPYLPVDTGAWHDIDAAAVLRRPLTHWDALPPAVRTHFLKRVVLLGPESTGKTTLAGDLALAFGTVWVAEYLRLYLDAKGGVCEPDDLPRVVAGHQVMEATLARRATRVIICDTDPLMTAVYSRFYYGTLPAWLGDAAGARRADHYLLLDCDVPWVADPQRDAPHARGVILGLCREELERRRLPFTVISGGWTQRFTAARTIVESLLREE